MREGRRRVGERGGEVGLVRRRRRKMLEDRKRGRFSSALGGGAQGKEGWGGSYVLPCVREERKREGSYLDAHQ